MPAGALLVGAFEPFGYWPLSIIALAVLFYLWRRSSPRQAFYQGLAFGYGLFGIGVSWVYVSLHTYGGMPLWMGGIAVLGFAGLLALFVAAVGYLAALLFDAGSPMRVVIIPFIWVLLEWVRSWILTGFPWLELGYSQTTSWLFGWAPLGGVYLCSFLVALLAALLVLGTSHRNYRRTSALWVALIVALSWAVDGLRWSTSSGQTLMVGIVQANIPIENKWSPDLRDQAVAKHVSLSNQLQQQNDIDLLIWPETALPLYQQQIDESYWSSMQLHNTALLTGLLDAPQPGKIYNAATLVCQGEQQIYRKRHLVPFGEYMPLRFLFGWVLEYLQLPMSDFSAWEGQQALSCGANMKIGLSICYEDAFASEMRRQVGDSTLLVNISEDAWFGDSFAPHQRLQMAQMRARELARPMIRSANTGPSAFINELGEVLIKTEQFEVHHILHAVRPQTGETPYKLFGNWVVWLAMATIGLSWNRSRRR